MPRHPVNTMIACLVFAFASTTAAISSISPPYNHPKKSYVVSPDLLAQTTPPTPATPEPPALPPAPGTEDSPTMDDDISLGEIPVVETVELTLDRTKDAIKVYATLRDKFSDSEIENFESLQEFVDQSPRGKELDALIKSAGFATVDEWNIIITTASFTYSNIIDDQTEDVKQQIEDIKIDEEIAQDMKDRMVKALTAMIPSENNRKIVEEIAKDPQFAESMKLLEIEEE